MIKINVGSKNPAKVDAVREVIEDYNFMKPFILTGLEVSSGISEQPTSQEEILWVQKIEPLIPSKIVIIVLELRVGSID